MSFRVIDVNAHDDNQKLIYNFLIVINSDHDQLHCFVDMMVQRLILSTCFTHSYLNRSLAKGEPLEILDDSLLPFGKLVLGSDTLDMDESSILILIRNSF